MASACSASKSRPQRWRSHEAPGTRPGSCPAQAFAPAQHVGRPTARRVHRTRHRPGLAGDGARRSAAPGAPGICRCPADARRRAWQCAWPPGTPGSGQAESRQPRATVDGRQQTTANVASKNGVPIRPGTSNRQRSPGSRPLCSMLSSCRVEPIEDAQRAAAPQLNRSANARATTFVARRRSSSSMCSSARLALLSSTVRGPQP